MLNQLRHQWVKMNLRSIVNARYAPMKPPNIIIRTDSKQNFEEVKALLESVLETDRYTVHHSITEKFLKASSWQESCCLLLCNLGDIATESNVVIRSYVLESDGRVLFYTEHGDSNVKFENLGILEKVMDEADSKQNELKLFQERCAILNNPIDTLKKSDFVFILNRLGITGTKTEDLVQPKNLLTLAYFLSLQNKQINDVFKIQGEQPKSISGKGMTITFYNQPTSDAITNDDANFPVSLTPSTPDNEGVSEGAFDLATYKEKLQTKEFGQNIIFTDTISSTQTILTSLRPDAVLCDGLVIHAKRQLKGKGRSGNQWLSPPGCMMFSMQMKVPLHSPLGRNLTIMQHLVIVAFVRAVKKRGDEYKDLNLHIKWPNDIYINKKVKIGGIIVNSCLWKQEFRVKIGLGVNVSNDKPTDCLNSLIRSHNATHGSNVLELGIEDALAGTLNEIELLVELFQRDGLEAFKDEYYKHWLHNNAEVTLECHNMEKADIVGIDNFGFLVVKLKKTGSTVTLQPDGNSFDMMRNMIIVKS